MGYKFSKRQTKLIEGDFPDGDQTLHITVDANALTGRAMDSINSEMVDRVKIVTGLETQTAQVRALSMMLAKIITKWDAEDGKPTVEFFMDQPVDLLSELLEFCMGLVVPKGKTASA